MKSRVIIPMLICLSYSKVSFAKVNQDLKVSCPSSKEYITTVHFLRDQKTMALKENDIQTVADEVSKGCKNASERFVKITKLLTAVGIDSKSAIQTALKFVKKEDISANAFSEIFKQTYEEDFLNLDALSAMKISLKLSHDYKGEPKNVLKEFKKLVEYCKESKSLDLPLPLCAEVASKITLLGQDYEGSISKAFIDLMSYLESSKNGPKLNRKKAVEVSERVLNFGPIAQKNFEQAFEFAVSTKGLGFTHERALSFAMNMAERSTEEVKN